MKTRHLFIFLLIAVHLSIYAENILKNPFMSKAAANGLPVSWNVRKGGTWKAVENGFTQNPEHPEYPAKIKRI